jgi:hypothetical protein
MRVSIDVPRQYWDAAQGPSEHRIMIDAITRAVLEVRGRVELLPYTPVIHDEEDATNGDPWRLHYAYHASRPGRNVYCLKPAAIPGFWFMDPGGYSGWSQLAVDKELQTRSLEYDLEQARTLIESIRRDVFRHNQSRLDQPPADGRDLDAVPPGFIFYPLQVEGDAVLAHSPHLQIDVISALRDLAEARATSVVIKRHPLCRSSAIQRAIDEACKSAFVHVTSSSIHDIIRRCSAVVVTNSGVGLEALVHGKPVFALGGSEYGHIAERVDDLAELDRAFADPKQGLSEEQTRQLGYLLGVHLVRSSDAEAIKSRVHLHLDQIDLAGEPERDGGTDSMDMDPTTLHAIRREISESVSDLISISRSLPAAEREEVSRLLVRAAKSPRNRDRVLKGADIEVARRIFRWIKQQGDRAATLKAARLIAQRGEGADDVLVLSRLLFERGAKEEGLELLLEHSRREDVSAPYLVYLATRLMMLRPSSGPEIERRLRAALELDPNLVEAHWVLCRYLYRVGETAGALAAVQAACSLDPGNGEYERFRTIVESALSQNGPLGSQTGVESAGDLWVIRGQPMKAMQMISLTKLDGEAITVSPDRVVMCRPAPAGDEAGAILTFPYGVGERLGMEEVRVLEDFDQVSAKLLAVPRSRR